VKMTRARVFTTMGRAAATGAGGIADDVVIRLRVQQPLSAESWIRAWWRRAFISAGSSRQAPGLP